MIHQPKLDHDIVWDEGGHLSEVAKSAIADGQDSILPIDALSHFSRCEDCLRGIGEAALLSAEVSAAFARAPRLSLPWIPIAIAILVAAASAIPMLVSARSWLSTAGWFVRTSVPIASHAFFKLAVHGLGPTFYLACTSALLAMGVAVARLMPQGGVK